MLITIGMEKDTYRSTNPCKRMCREHTTAKTRVWRTWMDAKIPKMQKGKR